MQRSNSTTQELKAPFKRLGVWLSALCALLLLNTLSACKADIRTDTVNNSQANLAITNAISNAAIHSHLQPNSKTLTLVTRPGPTTFYNKHHTDLRNTEFSYAGFDYTVVKQFADFLGRDLQVISVESLDDVYRIIENGQADIAASGLHFTPGHPELVFSPAYQEARQVVITRRSQKSFKSPAQMKGLRISIESKSNHVDALSDAQLEWNSVPNINGQQLLQQLADEQIDATIIYLHEFYLFSSRYPQLKVAYEFPQPQHLSWATHKNNEYLQQQSQIFLQKMRRQRMLSKLEENYYGHFKRIYEDGFNSHTFAYQVKNRLPKYQPLIKEVAAKHQLDWRLLAAIAYQESHWRPKAKSPTGVRGMMMLTRTTARELGVKNRLNAEQSLEGGVRYLKKIHQRFEGIQEPDRTWLTLAAYNVGWGHLRDAREITEFQGANRQRWVDVKQRLPLLSQKDWYRYTEYGFARGNEPVTYVQRIRHYHELLRWYFPNQNNELEAAPKADVLDVAVVDDAAGKSG